MNAAEVRQNAIDALKAATPLRARRRLVLSRLAARQLSANARLLPDFVILGGQRCGTSSMYKYLGKHPQIAPSLRKEIEYFTIAYNRGEPWYRAHFPLGARRTLAEIRGRSLRTFEATPDYLFDPRAPRRMVGVLPSAKLIIMLRDPVERAYSHYHHNVRLGQERLPFADAIAAEDQRLTSDRRALHEDPYDRVLNFRRFSYLSRGRYAEQITRWFGYYPRESFHIVMTNDLFERPEETFNSILRFVDVPLWAPSEFKNYSYTTAGPSTNPEIPGELHQKLRNYFEAHDERLAELLGTDLSWRIDG